MYDSFYHLSEKPFQISTDPRFLWFGEKHNEALATLKYGLMDTNGFVVLTGDIGTGKTTMVNALINALEKSVQVVKINHPSLKTNEFLTMVAKNLDPSATISDKSDLLLFFNAYLESACKNRKMVVLIIDEAHRLSAEVLEEIRMLTNIETSGKSLINIILVGQNEFNQMLSSPQCRAVRQRVTLYHRIEALSREETKQYIAHRLSIAGTRKKLFSTAAMHKIHAYAKGNPRLINLLCDRALLTGYVREQNDIGKDLVMESAEELRIRDQAQPIVALSSLAKILPGRRSGSARRQTGQPTGSRWRSAVEKWPGHVHVLARHYGAAAKNIVRAPFSGHGQWMQQHKKKIIPAVLATGIAAIYLALTVGIFLNTPSADIGNSGASRDFAAGQDSVPPAPTDSKAPGDEARISLLTAVDVELPETVATPRPAGPTALADKGGAMTRNTPLKSDARTENRQLGLLEAADLLGFYSSRLVDKTFNTDEQYARLLVDSARSIMDTSTVESEALLLKAIETSPNFYEAYLAMGKLYTRTKAFPKAIKAYQRAVGLNPRASDAFFNLGYIFATNRDYEAAEKAFARAVELKPDYLGKSLFNLSVVQHRLGKQQESMTNLEAAVRLKPGNARARSLLNRLKAERTGEQDT